jgi:hypothetical protein
VPVDLVPDSALLRLGPVEVVNDHIAALRVRLQHLLLQVGGWFVRSVTKRLNGRRSVAPAGDGRGAASREGADRGKLTGLLVVHGFLYRWRRRESTKKKGG